MNSWLNIATFGYNTTTKTSSFLMNSQDILTSLASKVDSSDLTNLRTTATKNINFKNSSGNTIMYLDDLLNVQINGVLTNTGGAQFTNGIQVGGGGNITDDANNFNLFKPTWNTDYWTFSVNGDITFNNLTQTSTTANKSLVLSQTGDTHGSTK